VKTTYVLGDTEVRRTGREAVKPAPGGKKMIVVEVEPVHEYDGTWKKWVTPTSLFEVQQPKENP